MRAMYPASPVVEAEELLAGVRFDDPFRWLEQETPQTKEWQARQSELASTYVRQWPFFDDLRALVNRCNTERRAVLPRRAGDCWFRAEIAEGETQARVLMSSEPLNGGTVVFDPKENCGGLVPFLSWLSPSPDARMLAIGLCGDGSERNTIRLIDVGSRQIVAGAPREILMDNWTGGVQWLPDSSGFFFTALSGASIDFSLEVYLHRCGTTERLDIPWTTRKEWRMVVISPDDQYAVAFERLRNPIPVAVAALNRSVLVWKPFVTRLDETVAGHVVQGELIAISDREAPKGRVIAIPLDAEDPNDSRLWREVVAESNAVLRNVTFVGKLLYLTELVNTYVRVRIVDVAGKTFGEVPLPGNGAISEMPFPLMNLVPRGDPESFLFAFSSLTESWGLYRHIPGQKDAEVLRGPRVRLRDVVVEDRQAVGQDGTAIPYHVVRVAGQGTDRPMPTLIYGYGGFNVPEVPQFPGSMAAFVASGGIFVHAHLRGGAELGRHWWQQGCLRAKQNSFNDLFAIAEALIEMGYSSRDTLAVTGASNGGLMAGVAATQRPDLWRVVVPRVPIVDLIGACRGAYGRLVVSMEYAGIEDPEEVRRLASFSPYQLVKEGVRYPAIFIGAGQTDPRCPPWHARKFAARLQVATAGEEPILVHVWEKVGHGWATAKDIATLEHTEWLAFVMRHLDMDPTSAGAHIAA